MQDNAQNVISI